MGLRLSRDGEGGEGDRLNVAACFLPLEKWGLENDGPGEGGWLILFLSDPLGEVIGLEGGD